MNHSVHTANTDHPITFSSSRKHGLAMFAQVARRYEQTESVNHMIRRARGYEAQEVFLKTKFSRF